MSNHELPARRKTWLSILPRIVVPRHRCVSALKSGQVQGERNAGGACPRGASPSHAPSHARVTERGPGTVLHEPPKPRSLGQRRRGHRGLKSAVTCVILSLFQMPQVLWGRRQFLTQLGIPPASAPAQSPVESLSQFTTDSCILWP